MANKTQEAILEHLLKGGETSVIHALNTFNCGGLSSLISRLRKQGYPILDRWESNKTNKGQHKIYFLSRDFIHSI